MVVTLLDQTRQQVLYEGYRWTPSYMDTFDAAILQMTARYSKAMGQANVKVGGQRIVVLLAYELTPQGQVQLGRLLNHQTVSCCLYSIACTCRWGL